MTYTSKTLSEIREAVSVIVQDAGMLNFTADEVDTAIRRALAELNTARPLMAEAVLTLNADGGELSLASYAESMPAFDWDALVIQDVFWPYRTGVARQNQTNDLAWYFVERNGDDGRLVLMTRRATPQSGDGVWLRYAMRRTINGLDGETETRLFPDEVVHLTRGAAAHLAEMGALDHAEGNAAALRAFAERERKAWRRILEEYGKAQVAQRASSPPRGWGNAWEERGGELG